MYTPRKNGLRHYSILYKHMSTYPEMAIFPDFLEDRAWMLNNGAAEIYRLKKECNAYVANVEGCPPESASYTILDYHLAYAQENHPSLGKAIEELEKKIRQYGKDLCVSAAIANLSPPTPIFAEHLAEYPNLFVGGVYGPTGGDADLYRQKPPYVGLRAWKALDQQDPIMDFVLSHLKGINSAMDGLLSKLPGQLNGPRLSFDLSKIRTVINVITCICTSGMLVGSMSILVRSPSMEISLGSFMIYVTIFSMSLLILIPAVKPRDLITATINVCSMGGSLMGARNASSMRQRAM